MQVTVNKLSPVLMELDVTIDSDRVHAELEKSFSQVARGAKVRGFRPGKAPRAVIMQMFGPRIASEVAQQLVDESFPKAVGEQKLQPISRPTFESERIVPDKPFQYRAKFEVLPEVGEVNYEGLTAKRAKVEVTDEQITEQVERIRREHATLEPLSEPRPIATGDIVTLDFTVEVGKKLIADAGTKGFQVELGAKTLLTDIENAVLGKQMGDSVRVPVKMPANHPHPKLRGKSATFAVEIKDVKTRVVPEADDELAKDEGEFETLQALRDHIRTQLEASLKEQSENALAEQLVAELVQRNPIDVPGSLVEQQMKVTEQEILQRARMTGSSPRSLGDDLRVRVRADSEMKVRAGLLMAEIAKKNQIKIGDKEIEEGLSELAEQSGKNVAKLRAEYADRKKREILIGMILENKILDLIQSKANIVDE